MQFRFSSVQSLSHVWLPLAAAHQASLSIPNSWSFLKLMPIESVMPSNHLNRCHPRLLLPSIFPSIRVSSSESVLYPTTILLPGKSHGPRSLVGCSPWSHAESDMTERLRFHFSLLCIGEGNGYPLQCSCLENPRDRVAQSRTRLKWLSSSTSSLHQVAEVLEFQL